MSAKPKVVVLCCDGVYQRHLVRRIGEEFDLLGVVRHATPNAKGTLLSRVLRYRHPVDVFRYLQVRMRLREFEALAQPVIRQLFYVDGQEPAMPEGVPLIDVANINEATAVEFVKRLQPDVLCINGTNLLRQPMLELIPGLPFGAINLHTGLSPYSRGGNCNLYMLLEGRPELVGLTVHHIDPGIDSGDIIFTARPELAVGDTYETIEAKTFHLGVSLMVTAIRRLQKGRAERVRQWEKGKLFLRKTGYVYEPSQRVRVNRLLREGLISRYLVNKESFDEGVRTVGNAG